MVVYLKKLMAAVALLATAHAAHASLIVNGGFENPDIDTLSAGTPGLRSGSPYGRPGNVFLGLPNGSSIPGWTIESAYHADLVNNNIGSGAVSGAYWPTAYECEQFMYLNAYGNNATSMYQTLGLTGGNQYSLEFFLNGLTGYGGFDGLPYQPQVLVSVLDDLLNPVYQSLVTGASNTAWTETDLDFAILNSGNYRLVFSTPSNPVLPVGQGQNFITLDNISLLEAPPAGTRTGASTRASHLVVHARRNHWPSAGPPPPLSVRILNFPLYISRPFRQITVAAQKRCLGHHSTKKQPFGCFFVSTPLGLFDCS